MLKIIALFFFFLTSYSSFSQTTKSDEYLTVYGQVWGFLKYFHPKPSELDWDKQLLANYENIKSCANDNEFNNHVSTLIKLCGSYKKQAHKIGSKLTFEMSFEWMQSKQLNVENQNYFVELRNNKPEFKNKYVKSAPLIGNPVFKSDNAYNNEELNEKVRFLALTRYWNCINYYAPNRDLIPNNWDKVYQQFIPIFRNAETYDQYFYALSRLSSNIQDGHGFKFCNRNPLDSINRIPFNCEQFFGKTYITYLKLDSTQTKFRIGDEVILIENLSADKEWGKVKALNAASNEYFISKSSYYFGLTKLDSVTISIKRGNDTISEKVNTCPIFGVNTNVFDSFRAQSFSIQTDSISGKSYAFINMGVLRKKEINRSFRKKLKTVDYLIIDVRNYPKNTVYKLGKTLINGKHEFAIFRSMNFKHPGTFTMKKGGKIGSFRKGYQGKILILVDYQTMSHAEYSVMALQQHPNATTIGGQTAGADGDISFVLLPGGIKVFFSGLGVFYPDQTLTQQVGVKRDKEIYQTIESTLNREDLILKKALELIRIQ
jgi:carboxyl-terminal processing protease